MIQRMIETPTIFIRGFALKNSRGIIPTILVRVVGMYISKINECVARIVFREKKPT